MFKDDICDRFGICSWELVDDFIFYFGFVFLEMSIVRCFSFWVL